MKILYTRECCRPAAQGFSYQTYNMRQPAKTCYAKRNIYGIAYIYPFIRQTFAEIIVLMMLVVALKFTQALTMYCRMYKRVYRQNAPKKKHPDKKGVRVCLGGFCQVDV